MSASTIYQGIAIDLLDIGWSWIIVVDDQVAIGRLQGFHELRNLIERYHRRCRLAPHRGLWASRAEVNLQAAETAADR